MGSGFYLPGVKRAVSLDIADQLARITAAAYSSKESQGSVSKFVNIWQDGSVKPCERLVQLISFDLGIESAQLGSKALAVQTVGHDHITTIASCSAGPYRNDDVVSTASGVSSASISIHQYINT